MPHVIVKLWRGPSERQKARLAEAIIKNVTDVLDLGEESVSVAIEEFDPRDWAERVYRPDIMSKRKKLYKKPGHAPSELPSKRMINEEAWYQKPVADVCGPRR